MIPVRAWRLAVALMVANFAAVMLADPPIRLETSPPGIFVPTEIELRRYLAVLPALLREVERVASDDQVADERGGGVAVALSREDMARLADQAGFSDLESFVRTHATVLAGYACLRAEAWRNEIAAQMAKSPGQSAAVWRERLRKMDGRIATLRREVAPETLERLRPLLPALERLFAPRTAIPAE